MRGLASGLMGTIALSGAIGGGYALVHGVGGGGSIRLRSVRRWGRSTEGLVGGEGGGASSFESGGSSAPPLPAMDWLDPAVLPAGIPAIGAIARRGSGHFGDIMGSEEDLAGSGRALLGHFEPLERIVLTANGNLQRIMSSFYNAPVEVDIINCQEVAPAVYDRCAELRVEDVHFCTANSIVMLHSSTCVEAVSAKKVPIGQLFQHLDTLPTFCLLNAGTASDGSLWRVYDLHSSHLSCRIQEKFVPNLFNLSLKSQRSDAGADS